MLILKENAANSVPTPPVGKDTFFIDDSGIPSVKASDGNVTTFPTVAASNAQVVFMDGTSLSGEAALTYDFNNNILSVSGNITAGNVKTDNLLYANGVPWDLQQPGGSNTQIQFNDDESFGGSAAFTFNKTSNLVSMGGALSVTGNANVGNLGTGGLIVATGNVTGGNLTTAGALSVTGNANVGNIGATQGVFTNVSGNGSSLSSITGANVTGAVAFATTANAVAGANVSGEVGFAAVANSVAGANVSGQVGNALVAGTVYTAAQPNITSVGTLSSLAVTGNGTFGNVYANAGTIGASLFTGTLTTAAQPNITSVGTLTALTVTGTATAGNLSTGGNLSVSGNTVISGNLTVDGNLVYVNVETLAVEDPIIQLQTGPNGATPSSNSGKDVGSALNYYDTQARIAFMGWDVSNAEFGLASQSTISNEVVTFSTYGNLRAGVYFGNAAGLVNIPGGNIVGNISGNISNATHAVTSNTVVDAAQPNITSVGTLTSLSVTGNASAGNISTGGVLSVTGNANVGNIGATQGIFTNVSGNGSALSSITGANVTGAVTYATTANAVAGANVSGQVANALVAGTVYTEAQPNITSVGTLSALNVGGNIAAPNITANTGAFYGNAAGLTNIPSGNISGQVANALVAGTVYTAAQPNITSVGTLTGLGVDGTVTAVAFTANTGVFTGNGSGLSAIAGGNVTGQVANALVAGTVYTAAQPNITSVGTLSSLIVTGNAGANNFNATTHVTAGNVYANSGTVGGSLLTGTLTTAAQPNVTSLGTLGSLAVTGNVTAGNMYSNSGTVGASLLTGTLTTAAQPNITSVGTLTSLTVSGNISGGNITGGALANGNSNISIPAAAGNVNISVNGTANVVVVTSTGINVAGTLNATGNANVGNLGTAGLITATGNVSGGNLTTAGKVVASTLESNVSSGTAPFVVASTTKVTNLNADLLDGYSTATAATANTVVIRDSDGSFSANIVTATLSGAATTAGTVTTAAQPNITSVGTLTSLAVTGNISAGNVSATTFTGALSGAATSATTAGTVTTAAQPNITSVGTLTGLTLAANADITMSGTESNINGVALVSATLFEGSGANLTNINASNVASGTLAQARLANSTLTLGSTTLTLGATTTTVAGLSSVTSTTFVGALTGAATSATTAGTVTTAAQPNITSVGTLTSLAVTGNVSAGNVSATTFTGALSGAATTAGTVTTAAQPNITSVGTLTGLGVNGNITAANITANTGVFTGNGSGLSQLAGGNVTGQVANALVAGTVYTAAQPNITSVGTLTSVTVSGTATAGNLSTGGNLLVSGNAVVSGNLNVEGNLVYINVSTLSVSDPIIQLQTGPNGAAPTSNSGKDVGTGLNYYDTGAKVAFMGWDVSNVEFGMASVATIANEVVTFSTYGNLRVGNIIGNGQALTGLAGGNVTGQVANALVAGTVYTAAQPNITSVGTLTGLGVNGTVTAVAFTANTGVFTGNANGISSVQAGNIVGTTLSSTVVTSSLTTVGTVGTGTWNSAIGSSATFAAGLSGANLASLNASNISSGTLAQARLANSTLTLGSTTLTLGATTTTVAGLSSVTSTTFVGALTGAATTAGTVTTAAQPNITSVGTLTSLGVNGTVTAVAFTANTGVFTGNGSGISAINGSNISTGTIAAARVATLNQNTTGSAATVTTAAQPNITSVSSSFTSLTFANAQTITGNNITFSTGANTNAGTLTGNFTLSTGSRLQATYADLAEKYLADADYEEGTVLIFGGDQEVTISTEYDSHRVAGVVSHNAAYVMNAKLEGEHVIDLALTGRVPVKVHGPVVKGDLMVTGPNGHAVANNQARAGTILGKALQNFEGGSGIIEVVVGRV